MIIPVRKIYSPVYKVEWRQIPPLKYGILPYYYISNTGLVYSTQLNRYLNFEIHGRETSTDEILNYLGIIPKSFEDRRLYQVALSPIRNRKNYKNICNQYNY